MITPGPASRTVTLLPRKRPTPMAPPIVIMLSWRCVSLRLSSLPSGGALGELLIGFTLSGHQPSGTMREITKNVLELLNLVDRVVVNQGRADCAAIVAQPKPMHQAWRVHVPVTNSYPCASHGLG